MKTFRQVLIGIGLFAAINLLSAAPLRQTAAPPDTGNLSALVATLAQTEPTPAAEVPPVGNFYSAQNPGGPPLPLNVSQLPAWNLGDNVWLLDDLDSGSAPHALRQPMGMDVPTPGDGGGDGGGGGTGGGGLPGFSSGFWIDTNGLYLQLTNYPGGLAGLNLMNATDFVYAVESTPALPGGWTVQTELFPTGSQTNVLPFALPTFGQPVLFYRAFDWTGITENGNTTPDWWLWRFYGTTALSDSSLGADGNTLLYDYTNGIDPNIISFTLAVTNNYVNSMSAPVQLNVTAGTPSFYAVAVDNTNYLTATNWQSYAGNNLAVNLGITEGWHDVWIGLRGLPANATQTWQYKRLKLDYTPPALAITSPTNGTVIVPVIQLTGYSPEALGSLSYDLSNAVEQVTNQPVLITDQTYDTTTFEFTTNAFQCFDVALTNGVNQFTLHATDLAGNVTTLATNFTLDYASKPPMVLQSLWPQNGMKVCGSSFVWNGSVSDPTAAIAAQLVATNGATNVFNGTVGRDGRFWVQNLPLNAGTNLFTLTATDAAGNVATTSLTVIQGDAGLTVDPIPPNQTTVTGSIASSGYTVWVNGKQATITGTRWEADNVPIPPNTSLVQVSAIPNNGGGQ
jgi:hypothetical protein